jgi:hypothetical protein
MTGASHNKCIKPAFAALWSCPECEKAGALINSANIPNINLVLSNFVLSDFVLSENVFIFIYPTPVK